MARIVDYRCIHCNGWKAKHKAHTFNCPMKNRGTFVPFHQNQFYEPNLKKPRTVESDFVI